MSKNQECGDAGELEVAEKIPCLNCGKKLQPLPKNYPLYDLQCTGCSFRVQVKTSNSKPKSEILGAGWEIMDKVLKSGFLMPSLIVNFKWIEKEIPHQKIIFYPFIPRNHIKKRQLSPTARRANYKLFNYIGLNNLPNFVLLDR